MIAYLKKEDVNKEKELEKLKQQVKDLRMQAHKEKETLMEEYSQQIAQLEAAVSDKDEEVCSWQKHYHWVNSVCKLYISVVLPRVGKLLIPLIFYPRLR